MTEASLRLDKWLKTARFFKRREDASDAVEGGAVKVNGERVKPSKTVKAGDTLTVRKGSAYRNYRVLGVAAKPVSVADARRLYECLDTDSDSRTPEQKEILKELERIERENRKLWREKPDKKKMRELRSRKYGQ